MNGVNAFDLTGQLAVVTGVKRGSGLAMATDNTQALRDDPQRSAAILDRIPAGRWGKAGDLAGAVVFLASSASDDVSGITLPVAGGWLGR